MTPHQRGMGRPLLFASALCAHRGGGSDVFVGEDGVVASSSGQRTAAASTTRVAHTQG